MTCQPTFPHQSSHKSSAYINASLGQHLADFPTAESATKESMVSSDRLRNLIWQINRILCLLVINITANTE
ncbi:hypothetical protein D9F30_23675 [Escherichia coli]|nr:hypothetical protein [Escherichia coli]